MSGLSVDMRSNKRLSRKVNTEITNTQLHDDNAPVKMNEDRFSLM